MIDYGFSDAHSGLIHVYFVGLIGVVAVLAVASGARYYLVMTLGERVVADLRGDLFAHLTRLDLELLRRREDRRDRLAPVRRHHPAQGDLRLVGLDRAAQFLHVHRRGRDDGRHLAETLGLRAGGDPDHRAAALRRRTDGAARSRRAQDTLADATAFAAESLSAVRVMQAFVAEAFAAARFRAAAEEAFEAARAMTQSRAIVTIAAMFLAFASVVVVLWLGASDVVAGRMTGGELSQFLLYAVLGAGALGQLSEVWNEVSQAAGAAARIGELHRRRAAHRRAGDAAAPALAGARRDRVRPRRLRLSRPAARSRCCAT